MLTWNVDTIRMGIFLGGIADFTLFLKQTFSDFANNVFNLEFRDFFL